MMTVHEFAAGVVWEGTTGEGTSSYAAYSRRYRVTADGKPDLAGSADPAFRGDADRHNPEDLFLAALSACHMLFYLSLCARGGVRVLAYEDRATGVLRMEPGGGGRFESVTLRPVVHVHAESELAARLHDTAHGLCFIANSCGVPIRHAPVVHAGPEAAR
jgi:organic hydroperoxide reductase OsmC/OhrA